ncbi:hypothetical protein QFZ89_006877 [Paraburkholderia youngii]
MRIETIRSVNTAKKCVTKTALAAFCVSTTLICRSETFPSIYGIPRRREWWKAVPGLGVASARAIEAFFAAWPALTERARALISASRRAEVVPWESLQVPHEVDGSQGTFRAPKATCALDATNDYEAVQTWLALQEPPPRSAPTARKPSA